MSNKRDRFANLRRGVDEVQAPAEHKADAIDQIMGVEHIRTQETSTSDVNSVGTQETSTSDVNIGRTQETHTSDVNVGRTHEMSISNDSNEHESENSDVDAGNKSGITVTTFVREFEQETKEKKRMEDEYTRHTFFIRNDLLRRFEKLMRKSPRGFQTRLINKLLADALDELEVK